MAEQNPTQVAALEKIKKLILEACPGTRFGTAWRAECDALEMDVFLCGQQLAGMAPVYEAANEMLVTEGVNLMPVVWLPGAEKATEQREQERWEQTLEALESAAQGNVVEASVVHDWMKTWGKEGEQ